MTRHILEQYTSLQEEVKDLRKSIEKIKQDIEEMEQDGYVVTDSVTCGKKGKKPLATRLITGFPYPTYREKKNKMQIRILKLENKEMELLETLNDVEDYINSIEDSTDRRILRMIFIDGMNQRTVANRVHLDQSVVSRRISKYFNLA